jgi:hypothetical protein
MKLVPFEHALLLHLLCLSRSFGYTAWRSSPDIALIAYDSHDIGKKHPNNRTNKNTSFMKNHNHIALKEDNS